MVHGTEQKLSKASHLLNIFRWIDFTTTQERNEKKKPKKKKKPKVKGVKDLLTFVLMVVKWKFGLREDFVKSVKIRMNEFWARK